MLPVNKLDSPVWLSHSDARLTLMIAICSPCAVKAHASPLGASVVSAAIQKNCGREITALMANAQAGGE